MSNTHTYTHHENTTYTQAQTTQAQTTYLSLPLARRPCHQTEQPTPDKTHEPLNGQKGGTECVGV